MTHEEFRVRYYELAPDGAIPLHKLCDYFQDAAGIDAHTLAFGSEDLGDAAGLTWVLTRMQLTPLCPARAAGGDTFTVHTWHSRSERLMSRREFYITNGKGETVLKGSTWWLLIDISTRRIARTPQMLIDMNPPTPEFVVEENNPKMPDFSGVQPAATLPIIVRNEDIDSNAHVNNTHFTAWALESAPPEIASSRALKELVITFKNECFAKDKLTMSVHEQPVENGKALWHILTRENDGKETARIYTRWE
ncbi:acyl-ACP thioesterase [Ereboglobus sp. PH5-5]|uniref:acyl-[acyl-carrier-protein] thioesterase n=1 Tax=unclassified Ereboglobus TaxID=2626932 RepID=UPI0024063C53|nr:MULTISPECIES: acyl-ACP thioesterase domain-containing protein [unclassified Ereboglobus]MDF9826604.1 acyl-ACP thioesterase [Ereboglobus sp. PH5-10]MDF9833508.1 acyl-ACP thioesterase [Ereboglobus sp. PH5-5]